VTLVVRPAAAADVEEAYNWYEQRRIGLGEEFLAQVRTVLDAIESSPARFPFIHRQTRRALVRRFPYGIYYRVYDEVIVVVACMHGRRDPQRHQSR
jgi:toxin ParE1/3/4